MKRFLVIALSALACAFLMGCSDAPAPQSQAPSNAPVSSAAFDEAAFLEEIQPIIEILQSCDQELYGAEVDMSTVYCAAYDVDDNQIVLYPDGEALPEGTQEDPSFSAFHPVSNFTTISELQDALSQYMAPPVLPAQEILEENFLEYDGSLYLRRGSRGYGTLLSDPATLSYVREENGRQLANIDYYMFGEYDCTAELWFSQSEAGWKLTEMLLAPPAVG